VLTDEQLEHLRRCADGHTLRYEPLEIVAALVDRGYAKEGIGRVVRVTLQGQQYLYSTYGRTPSGTVER